MEDEKVENKWTVPAKSFVATLMANVDNQSLSDAEFRQMFRNTLPIVEKPDFHEIGNEAIKPSIKKYYVK